MIEGVVVKKLKVIPDERGRLMEMFRSDDPLFKKFGQAYMTTAYPGVVKGWHYHKIQEDNMVVVKGMMKIVLYSPFTKELDVVFAGEHNPVLVHIPICIWHGFKCISDTEALVINIPSEKYNYDVPDEYRIPPHHSINYNWDRKDG